MLSPEATSQIVRIGPYQRTLVDKLDAPGGRDGIAECRASRMVQRRCDKLVRSCRVAVDCPLIVRLVTTAVLAR